MAPEFSTEKLPLNVVRSSTPARISQDGGGFTEIVLPCLEPASIYSDKAGPEILGQMYTFPDKKGRELCLRPEGTATCQVIARTTFKQQRDVKIYYVERCWRHERPQAGRYREFTQFGCEWLNPSDFAIAKDQMMIYAQEMVSAFTKNYEFTSSIKRGLAYYVEDGFEIAIPSLGAQKQVCGGGTYTEGVGFAIGVDRMMLI